MEVAVELVPFFAGGDVPEANGAIAAGRARVSAVGSKGDDADVAAVVQPRRAHATGGVRGQPLTPSPSPQGGEGRRLLWAVPPQSHVRHAATSRTLVRLSCAMPRHLHRDASALRVRLVIPIAQPTCNIPPWIYLCRRPPR